MRCWVGCLYHFDRLRAHPGLNLPVVLVSQIKRLRRFLINLLMVEQWKVGLILDIVAVTTVALFETRLVVLLFTAGNLTAIKRLRI